MANSTTHLDTISASQSQKEVAANALLDAASPATLFGRRASTTTALTWGYYGGVMSVDGVLTTISNGTVALTASATNYVEATRAGVVSKNTTGFTPGSIPLYTVVCGASTVSSYTDHRSGFMPATTGRLAKALTDANTTLSAAEARNMILEFSGTFTAQRNVVVPLAPATWVVFNGTAGGFDLQIIGATGTGIVIGNGKRAVVYADGTNIQRVTADL
jgi:hypothetical protein